MGISLEKGGRIDLGKEAPGLNKIGIGLGWDENESDTGYDFDLDASLFMLGANGEIPTQEHFIFYNNLTSPCGAVEHTGDNLTGDGDGDDELINVTLNDIPDSIKELVVVVTIHDAINRGQNFGQVLDSFIRIFDSVTGKEIAKYELDEDFSTETAIEFGRLYKKDGSWRFKAVGTGYTSGLKGFVDKFASKFM
jgi:tellurium resistance protein TerD